MILTEEIFSERKTNDIERRGKIKLCVTEEGILLKDKKERIDEDIVL